MCSSSGTICDTCDPGYYVDGSNSNNCSPCTTSNCISCGTDNVCQVCAHPFVLDSTDKKCYLPCTNIDANCEICDGTNLVCKKCRSNYYLLLPAATQCVLCTDSDQTKNPGIHCLLSNCCLKTTAHNKFKN